MGRCEDFRGPRTQKGGAATKINKALIEFYKLLLGF